MIISTPYHIYFTLATIILGNAQASIIAERAIQIHNPRAVYQGGWPLALSASNTTCPTEAPEKCNNGNVNPSCCPSGQSCVWSPSQFAFFCCPTAASCAVAVQNFPRCAITTWNMFIQGGSYFCCAPGALAVNPKTGLTGGLCESVDQPVPASLLATMASQIVAATGTSTPISSNATQIPGPNQTNPSLPNKSTAATAGSDIGNTITHWSLGTKIGVGIAVFVVFVAFLVGSCIVKRRRNRMMGYGYGMTGFNEYDEDGNLIQHQQGYRPGYENYRMMDERGVNNNVTVNVVSGDRTT